MASDIVDDQFIIEELSTSCFLCDHQDNDGVEIMYDMFEKRQWEDGKMDCTLSEVLSSALGQDLPQECRSSMLCAGCYETTLEYEGLEQRIAELRHQIVTTYNSTVKRHEPIGIEFDDLLVNVKNEFVPLEEQEECASFSMPEELVYIKLDDTELQSNVVAHEPLLPKSDRSLVLEPSISSFNKYTLDTIDPSVDDLIADLGVNIDEAGLSIYNEVIKQIPEENDTNENVVELDELSQVSSAQEISETSGSAQKSYTLEDHWLFKTVEKKFLCQSCDNLQWSNWHGLAQHLRVVHKSPVCVICGNVYLTTNELIAHVDEQHKAASTFPCEECKKPFLNHKSLRAHKRLHAESARCFVCSICNRRFRSESMLAEHKNTHMSTRPHKCTQCQKEFASKYTLKAHMKTHSERERPFKCEECGKAFLLRPTLQRHQMLHTNSKNHTCDLCSKPFSTPESLNRHMIIHSGEKPFICETCGKSFARRGDMKDHERIHTGERPFKCDQCDLAFTQRSNMMSHRRTTHMNEKLHKCDLCERSFKRRRLLDYHIHAMHTGERPYKCDICAATFVYPDHFKNHLYIHTGQKRYACEVCGKRFTTRENRNVHRFIHSEKKPYECLDCGVSFNRKPLLLAHIEQSKHSNNMIIINQPLINDFNAVNSADDTDPCTSLLNGKSLSSDIDSEEDIFGDPEGDRQQNVENIVFATMDEISYLDFQNTDDDIDDKFTWESAGGEE